MWNTLGTLISAGVPILQGLTSLQAAFPMYSTEIKAIHDNVMEGETITGAMSKYSDSFHPFATSFVDVGEQTGALPEMLKKCSNMIRKEMELGIDLRGDQSEKSSLDYSKMVYHLCFATLIGAGLPTLRALRVVSNLPATAKLKGTIDGMAEEIEKGSSYSEAMKRKPDYFDAMEVNLIKAGELGSVLEVTSARLADYLERKFYHRKEFGKKRKK